MRFKLKIKGVKKVAKRIAQASKTIDVVTASAVYAAGSAIMTEAKRRAPVDHGDLRGSGYVSLPEQKGRKVRSEIGFGGPASAYAIVQHERTDFSHDVGEAKYLERAISAKQKAAFQQAFNAAKRALKSGRQQARKIHTQDPDSPQGGGTQ